MTVTDCLGAPQLAGLLDVRTGAIGLIPPEQVFLGTSSVVVKRAGTASEPISVEIVPVDPGLFFANLGGAGAAWGDAVRVDAEGEYSYYSVADFDAPVGSRQTVRRRAEQRAQSARSLDGTRNIRLALVGKRRSLASSGANTTSLVAARWRPPTPLPSQSSRAGCLARLHSASSGEPLTCRRRLSLSEKPVDVAYAVVGADSDQLEDCQTPASGE